MRSVLSMKEERSCEALLRGRGSFTEFHFAELVGGWVAKTPEGPDQPPSPPAASPPPPIPWKHSAMSMNLTAWR